MNNAIKFSNPGNKIWLDAKKGKDENVVFSVQDEGIGMSPEKAATLFNLEETTTQNGTRGEKGTRLGLILSKEFVEMHGGKCGWKATPEKVLFSVFRFPEIINNAYARVSVFSRLSPILFQLLQQYH